MAIDVSSINEGIIRAHSVICAIGPDGHSVFLHNSSVGRCVLPDAEAALAAMKELQIKYTTEAELESLRALVSVVKKNAAG